MPGTIEQVEEYARSHPERDGGSWAGWCESFVYRAGGFSRSFTSAMAAGTASGPLNADWGTAPRGAIHYWAGVAGFGHVAYELGGGRLLMASNAVTDRWGVALGTVMFPVYARLGIPYRGWSLRHGSETLAPSTSVAGGGLTPILEEDDLPDMNEYLNTPAYTGGPTISALFKLLDSYPQKVWAETVQRGDVHVSVKQELADVKTIVIRQEAAINALAAVLQRVQGSEGGFTLEEIREAAEAGAQEAVRDLNFTVTTA